MKSYRLLFLTVPFLFLSCGFSLEYKLHENKWDTLNIPDKYTTGADESTEFKTFSETGEIAPGITLLLRTDTDPYIYMMSGYKNKTLPDYTEIRDYDFSDYVFKNNNTSIYEKDKVIKFINCKFKGFSNDTAPVGCTGKLKYEFDHCSFSGNVSSCYMTLTNCKIGGFTSDAMNPLCDFHAENLYVYDLLHEGNTNGTHIDGFQIFGDARSRNNVDDEGHWISTVETGNISFDNVRFEIPSIHFDGNTSAVNACVMFQLEFSDVNNVSMNHLYVNGGGKWYPMYIDNGKNNERSVNGAWSHENISIKNVMVSNNFGAMFYPNFIEETVVENVDHHDYLFVTSGYKSKNGTGHIIVTNDTNSDKELVVKTDVGEFTFTVPHCPSNWALGGEVDTKVNPDESLEDASGKSYMEYTWDDMPFDINYEIPGNPSFALCFVNDEQVRYLNFDGKKHYLSEIGEKAKFTVK